MIFREKKEESTPIRFNTPEDLCKFVKNEDPHCGITEEEKNTINNIGCSLNNAIRGGYELNWDTQQSKDLLQRLIQAHILKEDIIVNRAVCSIEYELTLAKSRALPKKLDTCRNLNPQCSDNDRRFCYNTLLMRFNSCSIRISKWTPNSKQLKIGSQT